MVPNDAFRRMYIVFEHGLTLCIPRLQFQPGMESNGVRSKIHISQSTADLLLAAGKDHWITKRETLVEAKGKGLLQTYWAEPAAQASTIISGCSNDNEVTLQDGVFNDKTMRLIDWNVDILSQLIRQIVARREALNCSSRKSSASPLQHNTPKNGTVIDEVKEIIELPPFDPEAAKRQKDPKTIEISSEVSKELREFVSAVATMYRANPFHNFEVSQ